MTALVSGGGGGGGSIGVTVAVHAADDAAAAIRVAMTSLFIRVSSSELKPKRSCRAKARTAPDGYHAPPGLGASRRMRTCSPGGEHRAKKSAIAGRVGRGLGGLLHPGVRSKTCATAPRV